MNTEMKPNDNTTTQNAALPAKQPGLNCRKIGQLHTCGGGGSLGEPTLSVFLACQAAGGGKPASAPPQLAPKRPDGSTLSLGFVQTLHGFAGRGGAGERGGAEDRLGARSIKDRKSTRLNSSH